MSTQTDTNHREKNSPTSYVTTFREGAIGANVFLNEGSGGVLFFSIRVKRSYRQQNGEMGYRDDFFDYNCPAVAKTSKQAAQFIQKYKDDPEGALEAGRRLNVAKKERAQEAREAEVVANSHNDQSPSEVASQAA